MLLGSFPPCCDDMVRLNKIYTRTGDAGTTALADGTRVPKTHPRLHAYGTVDELSAVLGLCVAHTDDAELRTRIQRIQNDLFDLGADLAVPLSAPREVPAIRVHADRISWLEAWIDEVNADLSPLESFILPGGGMLAAHLHLARTVARRAERETQALTEHDEINTTCLVYLNRLSDLMFVLARAAAGSDEVLWKPTRHDGDTES